MSLITLDDLKSHLNVTITDDDAMLTDKLAAAEAWIRTFVGFPSLEIHTTVNCVRHHIHVWISNDSGTLNASTAAILAWIRTFTVATMQVFVCDSRQTPLNVTTANDDATLTASILAWITPFGSTDEALQTTVKEALRQLAAHLYENREASLVGVTAQKLPFGLMELLAPYRQWSF